jgi:signal transduction histidine kinase
MDEDAARRLLLQGDHHERLKAARSLLGYARPSDRHLINIAAKREDDQYVRAALLRLLVSIGPEATKSPDKSAVDENNVSESVDLRSKLVRELTDKLTHEVATVVNTLGHYAEREVADYGSSDTKRELTRLEEVLQGLRQLGDAAAPPNWQQVDLARFIKGVVQDERLVHGYGEVLMDGAKTHEVVASVGLLALFLRNAIANAIEATLELHGNQRPVVVTWGTDDREHWITVVDDGPGPPGRLEVFAEMGVSTKDGHPGLGLTIATQVAVSLGGHLTLEPEQRGGSVCRLTWPRRETAQ